MKNLVILIGRIAAAPETRHAGETAIDMVRAAGLEAHCERLEMVCLSRAVAEELGDLKLYRVPEPAPGERGAHGDHEVGDLEVVRGRAQRERRPRRRCR